MGGQVVTNPWVDRPVPLHIRPTPLGRPFVALIATPVVGVVPNLVVLLMTWHAKTASVERIEIRSVAKQLPDHRIDIVGEAENLAVGLPLGKL